MTKKLSELPRKTAEKVIKIFATIHHDHYSKEDLDKINKALGHEEETKK